MKAIIASLAYLRQQQWGDDVKHIIYKVVNTGSASRFIYFVLRCLRALALNFRINLHF